ncbi:hypothetical protein N9B94_00900 [Verrucomicrobia bacterium]|nr:hypothetical protein [Verrucomicrobiota bacterium]
MSNELASPKVLLCPADSSRINNETDHFRQDATSATPYSNPTTGRNLATSYFIGLNATETRPQAVLSGDRNISMDNKAISPMVKGLSLFSNQTDAKERVWVSSKRKNNQTLHGHTGNLGMADGSVQQVSSLRLPEVFQTIRTSYGTNALLYLFPNE